MAKRKLFIWQGIDHHGNVSQGAFFDSSRPEAIEWLINQGWMPIKLTRGKRPAIRTWQGQHNAAFFRQTATLLKAGLTLSDSLKLLGDDHSDQAWQALARHIQQRVMEGTPFSEALAEWPEVFPPLCAALIKTSELTGQMDECCLRLANQQERQQILQKKVKKALRYPLFILMVALLVSISMLLWVLPEFASIYQTFNAPLPLLTAVVVRASAWLRHEGLLVTPFLLAVTAAMLWYLRRSARWQEKAQRILLRLPLPGRIYRGSQLSKIFLTLAMTQRAGLTLSASLSAVALMFNQGVWREAIIALHQHILSGKPLNQALKAHALFTPLCYQLIKVGEESGSLDSLLDRLGNHYEEDTIELTDNLAAALEPLMMVVTGAIVGTLVIAMYLPIFNLGNAIG